MKIFFKKSMFNEVLYPHIQNSSKSHKRFFEKFLKLKSLLSQAI
jgi:hypothetical protein